jgi:DNA primase
MQQIVDITAVKRDHPIAEVIARYGIALRQTGHALIGRCPFHADGGRPNLYVYPETQHWHCYRCGVGGDSIDFVERAEGIGFRLAVERLTQNIIVPRLSAPTQTSGLSHPRSDVLAPDERAVLAAAVELYSSTLRHDEEAIHYCEHRGIDLATARAFSLGYARGNELVAYLRGRRLSLAAAHCAGLLIHGSRELLAGRVIVPEVRNRAPVWLVGRAICPQPDQPKYLALPGPKPLLGWERATGSREVCLVEGPFDALTLWRWGYPAVALLGTQARPAQIEVLKRFERIYLVLDNDAAGRHATSRLQQLLPEITIPVTLSGVKDPADLGAQPYGRERFARSLDAARLGAAVGTGVLRSSGLMALPGHDPPP